RIKVYGVQAAGAPSMYNAVKNGKAEALDSVSTIADGIAVKAPGENTFKLVSEYVDQIVTVSDDEIAAAILALMEQQKLVTEGAGAAAVAAAMFGKVPVKGSKTVCLLSGGNIDVTILSRVIKRGLLMSGRNYTMNIELIDKPGQLRDVSRIIAELGGNVISIHHERANEGSAVNGCYLRIVLETRNYEHIEEIRSGLKAAGFNIVND
ncbi:MAG TPA: threonine ammonia-lyase, partial [Ruminococcus sp.]|nr:threonine ammonia-lyase [Ruminococcus sp.]